MSKPPLRINTTTLWEYPSQHYVSASGRSEQGDRDYVGATPSWLIWQLLQRYTQPGDLVVDPMCGSGTTIDVANDLGRRVAGFDLAPMRPDIVRADARRLPMDDASADFVFVDPPYSTHVDYSDDPDCIGKLDAGGEDKGEAYYEAMERVIGEIDRVLRPDRCMALYVSDSFRKGSGHFGRSPRGVFMPIGFELFRRLRRPFAPVDVVCVVRHNAKLEQGNFHKAAEEENFFLRGFNYLFVMRKPKPLPARGADDRRSRSEPRAQARGPKRPIRDNGGASGPSRTRERFADRTADRAARSDLRRDTRAARPDGRRDRPVNDRRRNEPPADRRDVPPPKPAKGTDGAKPPIGPWRSRDQKRSRNPRRS